LFKALLWGAIALLGAAALAIVAWLHGETVNALWVVVAAVCVYLIAYRFYARFIADKVLRLDPRRPTPAIAKADGLDFVATDRAVLFGHHFAAIAGAGPLVGPVLAAQMGYLPGMLWILAGVVLAGAVQDFMVLFISMRRDGRSLGELIRMHMGSVPGVIALFGTFLIMVIILAVLALIVVKALTNSPWGTFTIAATIPLALLMGAYSRWLRPGKIGEVSVLGFIGLMLALVYGRNVAESALLAPLFTFTAKELCYILIGYGFLASVLPVWALLAPRDYLSTFLKIGAILALAVGIVITAPPLRMPQITGFASTGGPVWSGSLFPFLFITIACGAVSGFHALIASGTTPKLIANEGHATSIGYGAMLAESMVAIMALVSASVIDPAVYFTMNSPAAVVGTTSASAAHAVTAMGFPVSAGTIDGVAHDVGETTIISRAGGAHSGGRHGADLQQPVWQQGDDGLLVSFRHPVRGAVYPHRRGCGHTRLPLHDPGSDRPCRAQLPQCDGACAFAQRHAALRRGMGVLSLSGGDRSAGRGEHAVAAVRHFEPDAGRDCPDAGDGVPVPDEAAGLCLGQRPARGLAADLHALCRQSEGGLERSGGGLSGPCLAVSGRAGERQIARPGQEPAGYAGDHLQRQGGCGVDPGLHARGAVHSGLWHSRLSGGQSLRWAHG
jgi:hypothetical protein